MTRKKQINALREFVRSTPIRRLLVQEVDASGIPLLLFASACCWSLVPNFRQMTV